MARGRRSIWFLAIILFLILCGGGVFFLRHSAENQDMLLHLAFDEGKGTMIGDVSGNLGSTEVHYLYNHAAYMEKRDPEWRKNGIQGGSLLFDGCSTYIEYPVDEIAVEGETVSVCAWIAPRMFEWDDPNAAEKGTEKLTAISGQYNKNKKQGFLLGYQRFGRLCFQVGTGQKWYKIWAGKERLKKYEWNFVAAVFDGVRGEIKLYLDGKEIGSEKIERGSRIAPVDRKKLLIGKNSEAEQIAAGTYNMFSGLMDDLRIYSSALSPETIKTMQGKEKPEIAFEDIRLENILTKDIYKTQYHGGPYQHWMNEPHAPLYYNGKYHLFFQENITGTYWRNICWGHLVSEDMVSWKPVKEAVCPAENTVVPDGVWSGGAAIDVNGVPVLFFTAGNDNFVKDGLLSNQNIGAAYPADLSDPELTDWVICNELAVKQESGQGRTGEFRDPHIWKEGNAWCMLVCSGSTKTNGGSVLLYRTEKLEVKGNGVIDMDWKYIGPVYEMKDPKTKYGTSWELPVILPISNEAGTRKRYLFLFSPAPAGLADNKIYYYVGDFDVKTGKFRPDAKYKEPSVFDYGSNVFTGPSAFIDPVSGQVCLFSIMQDQRDGVEEGNAGWAHCVGLTRNIWLDENGNDVVMKPLKEISGLLGKVYTDMKNLSLDEANQELSKVKGDMLYLRIRIKMENAENFGFHLKSDGKKDDSSYIYHVKDQMITGNTKNKGKTAATNSVSGSLLLDSGKLDVECYIDRSLIETFFNHSKSVSMRSYSKPESQKIELTADGTIYIEELFVAEMKSIY